MAYYNEQNETVSLKTWTRASEVRFYNPTDDLPSVKFIEETASQLGSGKVVVESAGVISAKMDSPSTPIAFVDASYQPTAQTFTLGELQLMIASLYMHFARLRDQQA